MAASAALEAEATALLSLADASSVGVRYGDAAAVSAQGFGVTRGCGWGRVRSGHAEHVAILDRGQWAR